MQEQEEQGQALNRKSKFMLFFLGNSYDLMETHSKVLIIKEFQFFGLFNI